MPVLSIAELAPLYNSKQRLLGLDLGTKTIGVAISDVLWSLASPLCLIDRTKLRVDLQKLSTIHQDNHVLGWVIGLPLNMDGTEGPRVQATRQFAKDVLHMNDMPIVFFDERLSTMAVERQMIEANVSRGKRDKKIDAGAAAFILQGVLDSIRFRRDHA